MRLSQTKISVLALSIFTLIVLYAAVDLLRQPWAGLCCVPPPPPNCPPDC